MPVIGIDAPTGGLNAFDAVDNMPPTDAIVLDNWIPGAGRCESRPGFTHFSNEFSSSVETLTQWLGIGTPVLIAGTEGKLYDITAGGAGTQLGTGYSNDRWQSVMINDVLVLVNGEDAELAFDGSSLTALTYGGSSPAITPGEFIGVTSFKGRAFYWKAETTSFWYAQAGAYQGNITEFPLESFVQGGGYVVSVVTWTMDAGSGPDDMLVIVFSTGEVILYQGDDPGDVNAWAQVGRFNIAEPLSVRGNMKYGSDVILMTKNGYPNLSTVLREDVVSDYPQWSRKIARLVQEVGNNYASNFGHECTQTSDGLLLFNVPISDTKSWQYVRNANTGAWARFTGWNAATFEEFQGSLYFGGTNGYVCKVGGVSDNGDAIELTGLPAYQYLGDAGRRKQLTAAQVLSTHPNPSFITLTGYSDFDLPQLVNTSVPPSGAASEWNTGLWNTFYWNRGQGATKTRKGWQNVHAFGFAVTCAVQMAISSQQVVWRQSVYRFRKAGAQ